MNNFKKNIINFVPDNENYYLMKEPDSAKKNIPKWYKEIPKFSNNLNFNSISNSTVKSCLPFIDALSLGYTWSLQSDIEIQKIKNDNFFTYKISWKVEAELVSAHEKSQTINFPPTKNGDEFIFKWQCPFGIKTPKGYSTFFTHPVNRHDLPFRTFSGVVDTDVYNAAINFPFQLLNFDENLIVIEKGTPVCQFFPIKREEWKTKTLLYDKKKSEKRIFDVKSKFGNYYKNNFWQKKHY